MRNCRECVRYRGGICEWLGMEPNGEPCEKFREREEKNRDEPRKTDREVEKR